MNDSQTFVPISRRLTPGSGLVGWSIVPAIMLWIATIAFALFFLHGFLELTVNNTSSDIANLHPAAKRSIAIHLFGLIFVAGTSFFAGCAWMLRRTRLAVGLSAFVFTLVVAVAWNLLRFIVA